MPPAALRMLAVRGFNPPEVKAAVQAAMQDPDPTVQQKAQQVLGGAG